MATNSNLKKDPNANAINMAPDRELYLEDTPLRQTDTVDEQFPAVYQKPSKKDAVKMAKLQTQYDGHPGYTPFGQLRATEDDFKWLQSKREAEERANFDQWFAWNFDHMSPAQKAKAKELYPSFYQRRMELLDKQVELTREIAKLKLNGIQNEKDLRLQYAMEKGIIDEDPLVNILHPERSSLTNDRSLRFKRGLLSRKAYPRGNWGLENRQTNAQRLLGKDYDIDAANFGTNNLGFSTYGNINADQEKYPANASLFKGVMLPPATAQAQAAQTQPAAAQTQPAVARAQPVNEFEQQAGGGEGFGQVRNN